MFYEFLVVETNSKTYIIEADTENEAYEKMDQLYNNEKIEPCNDIDAYHDIDMSIDYGFKDREDISSKYIEGKDLWFKTTKID